MLFFFLAHHPYNVKLALRKQSSCACIENQLSRLKPRKDFSINNGIGKTNKEKNVRLLFLFFMLSLF